ncbi:MAG: hypothetical protein QW035_02115 [Candidatus Anstonellales archaeon]
MRVQFILLIILAAAMFGCTSQPSDGGGSSSGKKNLQFEITLGEQQNSTVGGQANYSGEVEGSNYTVGYVYNPESTMKVYFFKTDDNRHRETVYIKKGDVDILFDAGVEGTADKIKALGADDIELLIVSNSVAGRTDELKAVADKFVIESMWTNGIGDDEGNVAYAKAKARIYEKVRHPKAYSINGMEITVYNPNVKEDGTFVFSTKEEEKENNGIVVAIRDRGSCILLTGNILGGAQGYLANKFDKEIGCKVLEVPYYGTGFGTAATDIFLLKVSPEKAVITGSSYEPTNSRYSIENKLNTKGIALYETFKGGTVIVTVNASGYSVVYE